MGTTTYWSLQVIKLNTLSSRQQNLADNKKSESKHLDIRIIKTLQPTALQEDRVKKQNGNQ